MTAIDKNTWRVVNVTRIGEVDLRRLYPDTWESTKAEFEKDGITLSVSPATDPLKNDRVWVVLSDLTIVVRFGCGKTWEYRFKRGYISDLASVPKVLLGIVDDDSREIILGALVHDANYAGRLVPFGIANDMLGQMIRKCGGKPWEGFTVWLAVSLGGKGVYNAGERLGTDVELTNFELVKG